MPLFKQIVGYLFKEIVMKTRLITLFLAICFWVDYNQVQAAHITVEFEGSVTSISGTGIPESIQVGDTFTGTYTYNSLTTDSDASPYLGMYEHDAPYGVCMSIGEYELKTATSHVGGFRISINNDDPQLNIWDFYTIESDEIVPVPSVDFDVDYIYWSLGDITHTAIDSDILPITAPALEDWNYNSFRIVGINNSFTIRGEVTEAVIPEPLTVTLMALGVIISLRKRRQML